ncbi:MAG: hypothetical protein E6K24_09735 [Gammaproteobacteria bacterium]|nr:MAG: hypothetical protein E6K24_09735 [Gammaproteobacteria bacterium]
MNEIIRGERAQSRSLLGIGRVSNDPDLLTLAQNANCSPQSEEPVMSKAMDTKKDAKKKPAKSLMEKRAAKKEKKANRGLRV